MTDLHLRVLAVQARRDQRRLQIDEARGGVDDVRSTDRRRELGVRAARTRARLAAARARRRIPPRS